MNQDVVSSAPAPARFPGWCCSYCGEPLAASAHGLVCAAETRFFSTDQGVHRLLPEDRHAALRPFLELYQRVRRDEGWRAETVAASDGPHASLWRGREARLRTALGLLAGELGPGPWRALDVGAGSCWLSARLVEAGHRVAAVDVNLDPDDGLMAAPRLLAGRSPLERAEAELDALPLEPQSFDLVVCGASLHYAASLPRALVELRRVTRRGGALLVLDSPVYRSRPDGEAMVAERMARWTDRFGVPTQREGQSGYLVKGELEGLFGPAGWRLEIHGWPGRLREGLRDVIELSKHGRRTARFPILLAKRDG